MYGRGNPDPGDGAAELPEGRCGAAAVLGCGMSSSYRHYRHIAWCFPSTAFGLRADPEEVSVVGVYKVRRALRRLLRAAFHSTLPERGF